MKRLGNVVAPRVGEAFGNKNNAVDKTALPFCGEPPLGRLAEVSSIFCRTGLAVAG